MKCLRVAAGVALILALDSLPAAARPATYRMSCASAQRMVMQQGGVVLDTSPTTFDRYVSDVRFCMPQQALRPQWVPAKDNPQCFIGYTCIDPERGWRRWGFQAGREIRRSLGAGFSPAPAGPLRVRDRTAAVSGARAASARPPAAQRTPPAWR